MTQEYSCGKPATSPHLVDYTLGWAHSVVSEHNFTSPWEAASRALELSFELCTLPALGSGHNTLGTMDFDTELRDDRPAHRRSPSFCEDVEVFCGMEDSMQMVSNVVRHQDLCQSSMKPWGWFFCNDIWHYDPDSDSYKPLKVNRSCQEQLSFVAASIRQGPQHNLLRLTDQWHYPLPEDARRGVQDQEEQEIDPDVIPEPTGAPTFVHDLFELAERHRVFTDLDLDGSMQVRTWYLHHQDERYCEHPRFLEFEEDWRRWENDIGLAWRDRIRPNEVIMIHVVFPDSFRGYLTRPVHADVIISQGHWLHRFSALSTIHHYHRLHPPHSYAVACSLQRRIGGIALAEAARVMYWCSQNTINCRTSYEWHDIPFSTVPTHEVSHGHAFNINIIDAPALDNAASSSTTRARKRQFPEIEETSFMQQPQEEDYEHVEPNDDAAIAPVPEDYESSSLHSGDIGILIFRLSSPDVHSFAPSSTYMAILEAAIRACRVRRRDIRCFHYVPATPTGVHAEAEEVIILQAVDDIAAGSDEKLVLLDLEIHFHPLRGGLLVPAAASRRVLKVNPTLHRDQLLLLTGLLEYCRLQHDRCTVFMNNELWSANDARTHRIAHGTYFRIQVPPPQDPALDTEIAIAIARDLAAEDEPERTEVAIRCRQRSNALSLRQIGASQSQPEDDWEIPIQWNDNAPLQLREPMRPLPERIRGRFADGHLWSLIRLRDRTNLIECEEEGRIMYVTIWFLHHQRQVRCDEGRSARLQEDDTTWLETIIDTWREALDPHQAFTAHVAQPTPACSRFECVQAHIIIEQSARPGHTTCLVSTLDERMSVDRWTHRAFSTTTLQNAAGIIRMMELVSLCQTTTCRVTLRGFPLAIVDFEELDPALNINVHVGGPSWLEQDYEDTDLMQRSKVQPVQRALNITGAREECENYATPALNPLAPVFHPDRVNIWSQPADIHALHAIWQIGASDWQGENTICDLFGLVSLPRRWPSTMPLCETHNAF